MTDDLTPTNPDAPKMTPEDGNNSYAASLQGDAPKTQAEIELAAGETPGDRMGDTPIPGVVQDHNGDGTLLATPVAPVADPVPLPTAGVVVLKPSVDGAPAEVSHVVLHPTVLDRIHHLIGLIEADASHAYTYVVAELRSLIPHHAA